MPFEIFIETKNTDWFYENQLERHINNLMQQQGQKIFLALANFDGLANEQKLFDLYYIKNTRVFQAPSVNLRNKLKLISQRVVYPTLREAWGSFKLYVDN